MKFLIFLFTLWTSSVSAELTDVSLGTGLINEHIGRFQTNRGGDTNSFEHRVYFNTSAQYQLFEQWIIIPEAGLLWPGGATENDYTSKYSYFFNGHMGFTPMEDLILMAGTGFYFTTINGDGGSASLPNGDNFTSFPVPDGASTSRNLLAIVGAQYKFLNEWSAKAQLFTFNLLSSRNRSFSYTLSVQYHFGDSLWK